MKTLSLLALATICSLFVSCEKKVDQTSASVVAGTRTGFVSFNRQVFSGLEKSVF